MITMPSKIKSSQLYNLGSRSNHLELCRLQSKKDRACTTHPLDSHHLESHKRTDSTFYYVQRQSSTRRPHITALATYTLAACFQVAAHTSTRMQLSPCFLPMQRIKTCATPTRAQQSRAFLLSPHWLMCRSLLRWWRCWLCTLLQEWCSLAA